MKKPKYAGIPKNTAYCYFYVSDSSYETIRCRYFRYKKCGKRSKNGCTVDYDKTKYGYYEYCKLLKRALSIGDQCKDCYINYLEELDGNLNRKR